ncbi:hypothetical protein NliqN6_5486 [Naganishia liquefaciens]|uniref:Major facilitator superfamily (MFS) profile domain-containing protein n=1 Tax=Naganishia liquefaciens TaxID=104408 RepID=A0A8H3TXT9_9TREE|nr:hypothetical protein NliqN6_5486 [Naganishia liquefaciens]
MSAHQPDISTFLPARDSVIDLDIEMQGDSKKLQTEHVENVEVREEQKTIQYTAGEDSGEARTGLRRLLRRNASVEFVREVARVADEDDFDIREVRAVERKIQWLIIPALAVCYGFYYIDKTTLSYAAVFDLKKALNLKGAEYSWLSSVFYFGWLAWAIPTNLLMARLPLAKYLSANILAWGVFLMVQGAVTNFAQLCVLRIISGAFEATADPAFVAITSMWFTRKQQPTVIGLWYSFNGVGIAFGGLLGYGIGNIPTTNIASWRLEFIIVGALCTLWSLFMFIFIPDAPYSTKWLTRRQAVIVVARKRNEGAGIDKKEFQRSQVWDTLKDVKTYLYFFLGFSANVPNGGTSNFGTLVIKGFGFSTLNTTLLQIPYGTFIALMIFAAIYVNHKTHEKNVRTLLMAGVTVLTVIGFALIAWTKGIAPRLIGYYLTGSSNAVFVLALSLVSGNTGGSTKKALTSASIFLGVALGNIVGPFCFLDSEAPTYQTGIIVCMVSRALEIVIILSLRFCFVTGNKKRDRLFAAGDQTADPSNEVYDDISDTKNMSFRYIC